MSDRFRAECAASRAARPCSGLPVRGCRGRCAPRATARPRRVRFRLRPPRRRAQRNATPASARRQRARRRAARESAASSPPSDTPTTSRSVIAAIARAVSIALASPKFRVRSGKSLNAARGRARRSSVTIASIVARNVERGIEERPNRRRNEKLAVDDALGKRVFHELARHARIIVRLSQRAADRRKEVQKLLQAPQTDTDRPLPVSP